MTAFLRSKPVAYAGHRIIANFAQVSDYGETAEHDEVLFLGYWFSRLRCPATGSFDASLIWQASVRLPRSSTVTYS